MLFTYVCVCRDFVEIRDVTYRKFDEEKVVTQLVNAVTLILDQLSIL